MDVATRARLIRVAMGEEPADLVLRSAQVVSTPTRELVDGDVAVVAGHIAAIGVLAPGVIGAGTEVIDVDGRFVAPGLIDPHVHVESCNLTVTELARAIVPRGVLTLCADPHEIANVRGAEGLELLVREAAGLPLDLRLRVPGRVPALPPHLETSGGALDDVDIAALLARPDAVAIGGDINPALLLLADDSARRQLVVLAASNDGLESALERLRGAASAEGVNLTDCLIQDNLALCPTGVANEPVEYELDTSGPAEEPTTEPEQPDEDQEDTTAPIDKGRIALGETKTAELAAEEIHAWTFDGGPATINIAVDPDTDMDAVLELYAPNGTLMANLDSAFAGGVEEMRGVEIPDDGQYFIVVRDFFNDGGHYQISIAAGEPAQPEPTTEPGG